MMRWLLVLGLTGCSLALTGPDPKAPRSKAPSCDSSKTLVVLDMIAATIAGVATLAAGANNASSGLAPGVTTALFIGSAFHGNSVVESCRHANDEYLARSTPDGPAKPVSPPPAVAEEAADEERPPPPPQEAAPPAPQAPAPAVPPPIELWVDFWKEIR
jgi:hypothetical protein